MPERPHPSHVDVPDREEGSVKLVTPGMRNLLYVAAVLVLLAGVQLFVFTERTDRFFAWTIEVPLTAAFLGAGYLASVLFQLSAARQRVWAHARLAVPTVLVFTVLTLITTLVHIDLFHIGSEFETVTQFITWVWIAVYAIVPVLMMALLFVQARASGADPPRTNPLPRWLRTTLALQAVVLLGMGTLLLVAPADAASLWPWELTELTSRATGAWVFSIGIAAVQSFLENDLRRVRLASFSYIGLGVLQAVALVRYPDVVRWGDAATIAYLIVLATILLVGVEAAVLLRRSGK